MWANPILNIVYISRNVASCLHSDHISLLSKSDHLPSFSLIFAIKDFTGFEPGALHLPKRTLLT